MLSCTSYLVEAQSEDQTKSYAVRLYSQFVQGEFDWLVNQSCELKARSAEDRTAYRESLENVFTQGQRMKLEWKSTFIDNVLIFPAANSDAQDEIGVLFTWNNIQYAWTIQGFKTNNSGIGKCVDFNRVYLKNITEEKEKEVRNEIMEQLEVVEEPRVKRAIAPEPKAEIFDFVEVMPEFPGGKKALMRYISKNIKYPEIAREHNIQGKAMVQFVVLADGSISNAKVVRQIGGGCGEEALRVVNSMPKWTPGKLNGKAVPVSFTLPVNFKLK